MEVDAATSSNRYAAWSENVAPNHQINPWVEAANRESGEGPYDVNDAEMVCLDARRARVFGVKVDLDKSLGVYTEELHLMMRARSIRDHFPFKPDARHLKYRRVLVDWMCEAGEQFQLASPTMFVAVAYLDRILQQVAVERNRLQLVAMCCLLIAGKFEEMEESVPTTHEINEYAMNAYTAELIQDMEILVLNRLGWKCTIVTPAHFLGYFLGKGVLFDDDRMSGKPLVDKLPRYVKKYAMFFADLSLQEYAFQAYRPSVMAAAIVAASRKALHVTPVWREELSTLTLEPASEVEECYKHLYAHYEANFPQIPSGEAERASPKGIDMI